jgi:hypothetical protein
MTNNCKMDCSAHKVNATSRKLCMAKRNWKNILLHKTCFFFYLFFVLMLTSSYEHCRETPYVVYLHTSFLTYLATAFKRDHIPFVFPFAREKISPSANFSVHSTFPISFPFNTTATSRLCSLADSRTNNQKFRRQKQNNCTEVHFQRMPNP